MRRGTGRDAGLRPSARFRSAAAGLPATSPAGGRADFRARGRLRAAASTSAEAEKKASLPAGLEGESLISADSCIFLGYRFYCGGRRQLAGSLYEICALMHPDAAALWMHIARARQSTGDVQGAIDAYERAQGANPWYGQPGEAIRRLAAGRSQNSSGPPP